MGLNPVKDKTKVFFPRLWILEVWGRDGISFSFENCMSSGTLKEKVDFFFFGEGGVVMNRDPAPLQVVFITNLLVELFIDV